jgi:hypothetical protein
MRKLCFMKVQVRDTSIARVTEMGVKWFKSGRSEIQSLVWFGL